MACRWKIKRILDRPNYKDLVHRGESKERESIMRAKSPLVQQLLAAITFFLVLVALAMIWPVIIALFFAVFLLLQSCSAEQATAVLIRTEVDNWSIFVAEASLAGGFGVESKLLYRRENWEE